MTTMATSTPAAALPTADELRDRVRAALGAIGARCDLREPGTSGLPARTPITDDMLFSIDETTAAQDGKLSRQLRCLDPQVTLQIGRRARATGEKLERGDPHRVRHRPEHVGLERRD